jgi:hypothetical protein
MTGSDKRHFDIENFVEVVSQENRRHVMIKNSTITKLGLSIAITILFGFSAIAAPKRSNSLSKRPMAYQRIAPVPSDYREPFVNSIGGSGLYHNHVLPDGTVTGPIGPEVNGG